MLRFNFIVILLLVQTAAAQTFRVATFNVESYLDVASGNRHVKSPEAKAKVRECILAIKPDIIALEEIGSTNALLELQGALKEEGLDLPNWELVNGRDTHIHVAFLSRFPILERRPHTNETFLLSGRRMQVSRGFAEIEVEAGPGCKITLIAAHLKSKLSSPEADEAEWRLEEAQALRRIVDARLAGNPDINLVVLGDLNDLKDSKPVKTIIGHGKTALFDTRPAERNGDNQTRRVTWTEHYGAEDLYSRIDYILVSRAMKKIWQPDGTWILNLPNWGVASDHRAIVASFLAR